MRGRTFLAYAIVTSIGEMAALLLVLLWLLPSLGLRVPLWVTAMLVALMAAQAVVLTLLNSRALNRRPLFFPDAGAHGRAVSSLDPGGYVRVQNELWAAVVDGPPVETGEDIVVVRREGMRLVVSRNSKARDSDRSRDAAGV